MIPNIKKSKKNTKSTTLVRILSTNKFPFKSLQQLYEFEFSPITKNDTLYNGLYDRNLLSSTWHKKHHAYILYLGKLPVGFAVINLGSKVNNDCNTRDMAEFFIMPNYRNLGLGRLMAFSLFKMYLGKWEIRQLYNAKNSYNFWISIIAEFTKFNFTRHKMNNKYWKGYLQTFMSDIIIS